MSKLIICLLFVLIQTGSVAFSQTREEKIDALLQSYTERNKFSGNVLVAKGGEVFFENSYGLANRTFGIPNFGNTKFRIASLTKQFTAVLIMQLVEAGKLDLHTPITTYLPYYREDTGNIITIHHLLTHTSGLPNYTQRDDFFPKISRLSYTHQEFVEKFCSDSLLFEPGTQFKYSNTNYYILGAIIEEVTQKSFAEVLQKRILDVVGMKNTGVEKSSSIIKNKANGYNFNLGTYLNADYIDILSAAFSAGAMYSTTGDLLLWNRALLFTDTLLTQESREIMFSPFLENYGYGVGITTFFHQELDKDMHFIFHQGAINGFRSIMTYIVGDDILIILLNNNFDTDLNPINNAIFSIIYNLP
jgi:CubicO group peptidase (beta-lactamase class C family)